MLKIRMQRIGRKNMPAFRIIVAEHTRGPKTGNIVEKVGTYNPKTKEKQFNADRIKHWLSVGAQASATVHNMLVTAGIISGKKIVKHSEKPVPAEGGSSSGGEADTSPAVEEPKEEVKAEQKTEVAETVV